jgi:hypothetical protein
LAGYPVGQLACWLVSLLLDAKGKEQFAVDSQEKQGAGVRVQGRNTVVSKNKLKIKSSKFPKGGKKHFVDHL